jgi:hypothetical protein
MKISSLEKAKEELQNTTYKDYKDQLSVELGMKCLVVCIYENQWVGPLCKEIDGIPITYIFGVPKRSWSFTK